MCPQWILLSDSRAYHDRDMFVTVRIQTTTLSGVRSAAMAVVFVVLSFFALSALCSVEGHATAATSHEHTTSSAHSLAHAAKSVPSHHCHHDGEPVHGKTSLDRALHRPDDAAWDAQSSSHEVPASCGNETATVPGGRGAAFRARTSGPPTPGRRLLVLLSVARN
jgi:hypothetical protein